jgi:hypothetical protein
MSFQWRACWTSGPQKLARRPHSQTAVRVALVVVFDPSWDLLQDGQGAMFPLSWSTVSEPARAAQLSACSRSRSKAAIPLPARCGDVGVAPMAVVSGRQAVSRMRTFVQMWR